MYQSNKQLTHSDKVEETDEYCQLPPVESANDACVNKTYSSNTQIGSSLPTAGVRSPPTREEFGAACDTTEAANPVVEPPNHNELVEQPLNKETEKTYGCHECGKLYSDQRSLERHSKTHRKQVVNENHLSSDDGERLAQTGTKSFQCQQCPRQFERRSHYRYHVKIHHGPREFKCQICNKAFVSRGALTTHGRIHSGEKPYECETCGRRFNVNSNLLAHVPKCTGTLPFKCSDCDKAFATRSLYQKHIKVSLIFLFCC